MISPAAVFVIILAVSWAFSRLFSRLALRTKKHTDGQGKSYACGEDTYNQSIQPDYSSFFSFAFFFTLAHVAALIMATVSVVDVKTLALAGIYIAGAVLGLYILFRRQD